MGANLNSSKGVAAEMNVVPLIDILLVLIIIFMVISPLSPKGLHAVVPEAAAGDTIGPVPKPIVVQVSAGGELKINQMPTTWNKLGEQLEDIFKYRAAKVAFVKGDDSADFADVARAIDIMRSHGIDKVGLMTAKVVPA